MNNLLKKLMSKAGESLVESMAAILVFTFASIIMLSMVSAAADINTTAKNTDRSFNEQMVVAERGASTDRHTSGTVTFNFGSVEETVPVDVFQKETGDLYAYYKQMPATLPEEAGG